MKGIVLMVLLLASLCVIKSICSKRKRYNAWLNENKAKYRYQTINKVDTLIKIYEAVGSDGFSWNYTNGRNEELPNLLWYRISEMDSAKWQDGGFFYNPFTTVEYFLIDMPWWSCVRFRRWEKKYLKHQDAIKKDVARCRNNTNDVLQDIQRRLDAQIQQNHQQMKDAAVQQEQVFERLSR